METQGIHHITALASDPQANLDFYRGVLGLRLVKRTVNFDAPDVYHLYYGDELGRPGTILTFFPFPDAAPGKRGTGETSAVAFSVPSGSLEFWLERLSGAGKEPRAMADRFGEKLICCDDPDGMRVEMVEDPSVNGKGAWSASPVDAPHAIRRFHGVTFTHKELDWPARFLAEVMGFASGEHEGARHRFLVGPAEAQARIDIVVDPALPPARQSAGSVHHIAWRAKNDDEQLTWRKHLMRAGASPTQVMDRSYFHSIYFREPGGVLFEIATDPPGFATDEAVDSLGTGLMLPPWLESEREMIERHLPPISLETPVKDRA